MTTKPFISYSQHWDRNLVDSQRAAASPALRVDRSGNQHPGVILSMGPGRMLILTTDDALRIANEIADAITAHREATPWQTAEKSATY